MPGIGVISTRCYCCIVKHASKARNTRKGLTLGTDRRLPLDDLGLSEQTDSWFCMVLFTFLGGSRVICMIWYPRLDVQYANPAQHFITAGWDVDYLVRDLSDLSDVWMVSHVGRTSCLNIIIWVWPETIIYWSGIAFTGSWLTHVVVG